MAHAMIPFLDSVTPHVGDDESSSWSRSFATAPQSGIHRGLDARGVRADLRAVQRRPALHRRSHTDSMRRFASLACGVKTGDFWSSPVPRHVDCLTTEAISQAGGQRSLVDIDESTYNPITGKL